MNEYHKILSVWERDPDTNYRTLIEGQWATPEFEYLKDQEWIATEKIDGTNIRVIWKDIFQVQCKGKTDNADIPPFLLERLQELFYAGAFETKFDGPVCLYGEGFGNRIQKEGELYIPDGVDFCLLDVKINDLWLERHNVTDIAQHFEVPEAPIRARGTLNELIEYVRSGPLSEWGMFPMEGLVARPAIDLQTRRGHRIITKIKYSDFK